MATGGFSKNDINFFRSGSALLNVGAPTLRKLLEFKTRATPGFNTVEDLLLDQNNQKRLKRMNSRVLPKFQQEMLYPSNGRPDVNAWDITLLCLVLSSVCSLSAVEESFIKQMRFLRNTVYGHKAQASMGDDELDRFWKDMEATVEGLFISINCPNFAESMRQALGHIKHDEIDTGDLESEIEEFLHHEDVIADKVDELTKQMTAVRNKVEEMVAKSYETTSGTTQQGTAPVHMSKETLQSHLLDLYDDFNVPVAPLLSEREDVDISDLYAELTICDGTDSKNFSASIGPDEGHRINTYRDLFQIGCKRSQKRHFLVGNAGSGKSTYCRKLLSTWCSALKKNLSENHQLSDDELQSLEFDFVFFIPLCEVVNCTSVEEMIQKVFTQRAVTTLQETILSTISSPESKCLLILDGLDEWVNQTDRNMRHLFHFSCTTLVTTRHWTLEKVPKNLQGRLLEIKPMEERNTRILVRNILHHVYTVSATKLDIKVEQFLNQMKRNNLMEIVEIPLMLTYFVCLWFEEDGLDKSFTINYGGVIDNMICYCTRRDKYQSISEVASEYQGRPIALPSPMSFRKHCVNNSLILYKLGCFAFESLLHDSHGAHTFEMNELESRIGKAALDLGLKFGILSLRRITGHVVRDQHKVQYLHRSIQEFLASLWLVSLGPESSVNRLETHCSSLEKLLGLQNVFRFVCGLKPSHYNRLSKIVIRVASNSDEVQTYRHSLDNPYGRDGYRVNTYHIAKEVQDMLLAAFNEAMCNWKYVGCKQGDSIKQHQGGIFYMPEIKPMCHIDDLIIDETTEKMLEDLQMEIHLKSIHVVSCSSRTPSITTHIRNSTAMERLHLDSSVSGMFLEIPNHCLRRLRSLTVTLNKASVLPEQFLHMNHVSALCLCVTGSHSTVASLMKFFKGTTTLNELEIEHIECLDHNTRSEVFQEIKDVDHTGDSARSECKFMIDLTRNNNLKRLSVDRVSNVSVMLMPGVDLKDVSLHGRMHNPLNVMYCLMLSESLTHLTLGDLLLFRLFRWDENDVKAIIRVIETLSKLKYLHMMGIDFKDRSLRFPSEATQLETVYLEDVAMSSDSWQAALRSLINVDGKVSKTSVLVSSASIDNDVVHFVNQTEEFKDVVVTTRADSCMVRFNTI